MKRIKLLLTVAVLTIASSATAQFTNSNVSSNTSSKSSSSSEEGWKSTSFSYDFGSAKYQKSSEFDEDLDFKGFNIGFNRAISISSNHPMFFDFGLGFSFMKAKDEFLEDWGDNDNYGYWRSVEEWTTYTLNIPLSLKYVLPITDKISLIPIAGLNFNIGMAGKNKYSYNSSYSDNGYSDSKIYDDDDDEMGEYAFNRFQFGFIVGAEFHIDQVIIGVKYTPYVTEMTENYKYRTTSISVGYKF